MSWSEVFKINNNMSVALNELIDAKTTDLVEDIEEVKNVFNQSATNFVFQGPIDDSDANVLLDLSPTTEVTKSGDICSFTPKIDGIIGIITDANRYQNTVIALTEDGETKKVFMTKSPSDYKISVSKNKQYKLRLNTDSGGVSKIQIVGRVVDLNFIKFN